MLNIVLYDKLNFLKINQGTWIGDNFKHLLFTKNTKYFKLISQKRGKYLILLIFFTAD